MNDESQSTHTTTVEETSSALSAIAQRARQAYVEQIAHGRHGPAPWWTAVIITASSARQAGRYEEELARRRAAGKLPAEAEFLVVPDLEDQRMGSGGATLNALRALADRVSLDGESLRRWWVEQRVLIIHSGGDSRRLPSYSLSGKLFSALPVTMPWGDVSTVFDETLALSTLWASASSPGLVVASGDVLLTFDERHLQWAGDGVRGVAIRQPAEVGTQHGVYILDDHGRVYAFLQKPTVAEVQAAGGLLDLDQVALDTGLLHLDPELACRLTVLGRDVYGQGSGVPAIDLYQHVTLALTGQWTPSDSDPPVWHALAHALRGARFRCALVNGEFTHVGTTSHFRTLITADNAFTKLYAAQQRLGKVTPPGMTSAGVIIDSVFSGGGDLAPESIAIECNLRFAVRAGRGAILHGLSDLPEAIDVPEDTVVHQVPVHLSDHRRGVVVRVYGVLDNPKAFLADGSAQWFGRPMSVVLTELGMDPAVVWHDIPQGEQSLWNARLFAVGSVDTAWACAAWIMGLPTDYDVVRWQSAPRLSLESSAVWADTQALDEARNRRLAAHWQLAGLALARAGSDIRPLLAHAPAIGSLSGTGRALLAEAVTLQASAPTEAASLNYQASLFFGQAGLERETAGARTAAFTCVRESVNAGVPRNAFERALDRWQHDAVFVAAPPRIDLGGGWSDTPPFCLDWGGTVLNMALTVNGKLPISATIRRIPDHLVRCSTHQDSEVVEFRTVEDILAPILPGSSSAIPRAALQLAGIARKGEALRDTLRGFGGGLDIHLDVDLPMGSGLGTSSILAAAVLRGLGEMLGLSLADHELVDQVLLLEQAMTSGGGWQDQAGGIFPGAKVITSGPGLRQRLRVQPLNWSAPRQAEFAQRFVFYYTGIQRVAKDLLAQVVGSYLAREVSTIQVLHSIKTLAVEMGYAMQEGEWDYLGRLMNRHWQLNQELDPHTTNAPINSLLEDVRPWLAGAKLAGAGGGGFLLLLARGPEEAALLRRRLSEQSGKLPGALHDSAIANDGMLVTCS